MEVFLWIIDMREQLASIWININLNNWTLTFKKLLILDISILSQLSLTELKFIEWSKMQKSFKLFYHFFNHYLSMDPFIIFINANEVKSFWITLKTKPKFI